MRATEAAYPAIHYNCTPWRKDWLFVRKEALCLSDAAREARMTQPPLRLQPIRGSS